MAWVRFETRHVETREIALPAFAGDQLYDEDRDGYPHLHASGCAILSDGSSLKVSIVGDRDRGDFGGSEFTAAEITVTFERYATHPAGCRFGSDPASRDDFAEILAVLDRLTAKVRSEMEKV